MRPIIAFTTAITLMLATPVWAQTTYQPGTISLTGVGEVSGVPDMAMVNSGVVTHGKTARDALDANTAAMSEIFAVMEAANVELRDIQTSGFSVQPQYVYSDRRDENGYPLSPRIVGYQVSNSVTVRVRNLDSLGQLLDSAVSVGANQINSISFAVSDPAPLLNDARRAAMADAIEKAELYAKAAGLNLGNIISITEGSPISAPRPEVVMMARMPADSPPAPVAAGELGFSKQVSVIWQLEQN